MSESVNVQKTGVQIFGILIVAFSLVSQFTPYISNSMGQNLPLNVVDSGYGIGVTGQGEYVKINHDPILNIDNSLSIAVWFNTTNNRGFLVRKCSGGYGGYLLGFNTGGKLIGQFYTGASYRTIISDSVASPGWHMVVYTLEKLNSTHTKQSLFLDATLVKQTIVNLILNMGNNTQTVSIASRDWFDGTWYQGTIDEILIYDYAMGANEIIYDFNNGFGRNTPLTLSSSLKLWLRFNEGSGFIVHDESNSGVIAQLIANSIVYPRWVSLTSHWDYHSGRWEFINKPGFPVNIPRDFIQLGENYTYVYTLDNDSVYHIYFYGNWTNPQGSHTDYDVYVFGPSGHLESTHTESAGLLEHLGTTVDDPFFKPKTDGNYSFLIINDDKESQNAESGSFMLIEHLEVNTKYSETLFMQGPNELTAVPQYHTIWVYEFNSSSKRIQIPIDVPTSLDMYEARLYLMANPTQNLGSHLLGAPIAWEPGLYADRSQEVGGFNSDPTGYRGNTFDSCEYNGQTMLLNYTSPYDGNLLYHLVFIAESGYGYLNFTIRTDTTLPSLAVLKPKVVLAGSNTSILAIANDSYSGIESVNLLFSTNNGNSWNSIAMVEVQSRTYKSTVPGQTAGTTVIYKVIAEDYAGNQVLDEGTYQCKNASNINLSAVASQLSGSGNLNLTGTVVPGTLNNTIMIQYVSPLGKTITRISTTDSLGHFSDTYLPDTSGTWRISASWDGNMEYLGSSNVTLLAIEKMIHTLDVSLGNTAQMVLGEKIWINGTLSPALSNVEISLILNNPKGNTEIKKVVTSPQGQYALSFEPTSKGSWDITAVFGGNSLHKNTSSNAVSFEVTEPLNFLFLLPLIVGGAIGILILIRRFRGFSHSEY
ncbi:MAG: LamG-like jellyroll fold domain-containing protein [Candidatus Bathyarchaeota archaeon]